MPNLLSASQRDHYATPYRLPKSVEKLKCVGLARFPDDDERFVGMKVFRISGSASVCLAIFALSGGLAGCTAVSETASKKLVSEKAEAEKSAQSKPQIPADLAYQKIGKPYQVRGTWYTPKAVKKYSKVGLASWYGPNFHGGPTANGEMYDQNHLSAAHKTLPLPSYVRVTNLDNDTSVIVRVNDRGPFVSGRVIDLSKKAAEMLDMTSQGVAKVQVDYVGPAPETSDDMAYLLASYKKQADLPEGVDPERFGDGSVQVAEAATGNVSGDLAGKVVEKADAKSGEDSALLAMVEKSEPSDASAGEAAANNAVAVLIDDAVFPTHAPIPLKK